MSPATSRRTVLCQVMAGAIGLPAAGLLAACGAAANAELAKYVGK